MTQRPPPAPWRWSYVAFRLGDGASHALIALAVVLHYGLPVWAVAVATTCMNLVGVPATFLWGAVIDRVVDRRRVVVFGFAAAGVAMALLALLPPFPVFVAGAMLYTMFGVSTSPAASILALQGVPQAEWGHATSRLSRATGFAFLTGMLLTIALGFALPTPPFQAIFLASACAAVLAAVIASRTIPQGTAPQATGFDASVTAAGQRLFERAVYFPGRMRDKPTLAGLRLGLRASAHRLWPLGTVLTFMGSVAFFTSYTGILADDLALPAGIVLLCSAPSHIVTPIAYPWAARTGIRAGKSRAIAAGALLRLVGLPGLCIGILALGASAVPLLIACHALMGVSFSLLQVNGPLMLAEVHPGGKGQGVGLHHAALGAGTLAGSLACFILLRAFDYWVSYVFSMAVTVVGVACLVAAHRQHLRETRPAGAPA